MSGYLKHSTLETSQKCFPHRQMTQRTYPGEENNGREQAYFQGGYPVVAQRKVVLQSIGLPVLFPVLRKSALRRSFASLVEHGQSAWPRLGRRESERTNPLLPQGLLHDDTATYFMPLSIANLHYVESGADVPHVQVRGSF